MSLFSIIFLLYLSLHACNARRLGFFAEEIGDHVDILASKIKLFELESPIMNIILLQDANKPKDHKIEMEPSISKKLQTGVQKVGAKSVKHTLLSPFLHAKPNPAGYGVISSSRIDLQNVDTAEGLKRATTRLMLGNSDSGAEEDLDSKEKDNVGDIDVMDYAQPHRKPPIHNEKIKD